MNEMNEMNEMNQEKPLIKIIKPLFSAISIFLYVIFLCIILWYPFYGLGPLSGPLLFMVDQKTIDKYAPDPFKEPPLSVWATVTLILFSILFMGLVPSFIIKRFIKNKEIEHIFVTIWMFTVGIIGFSLMYEYFVPR
jgi:flagellar biogenesis protein FliO